MMMTTLLATYSSADDTLSCLPFVDWNTGTLEHWSSGALAENNYKLPPPTQLQDSFIQEADNDTG